MDAKTLRQMDERDLKYLRTLLSNEFKRRKHRARNPVVAAEPQGDREFCPKGHPYEGSNLYVNPSGQRQCKRCAADRSRAYRAKKRDAKDTLTGFEGQRHDYSGLSLIPGIQ